MPTMASIIIYFEGAKFFSHREGDKASARAGVGFLGRGSEPPPDQLGSLGERCKLPQKFEIWCNLILKIHYRNAL